MSADRQAPAEWVADAARTTLALGSVRVWERRFSDPPPRPEWDFTDVAEGVSDLTSVRTVMRSTIAPVWAHLAELIVKRFPWLDDGDEADDDDDDEAVAVYAGTAAFLGHGDRWMALASDKGDIHAGSRGPTDPLWIVEALTVVDEASVREGQREIVRGAPCQRLGFMIDMRTKVGKPGSRPSPRMSERLRGDVWIDGDDRVRRVTWRRPIKQRPRSPIKPPAFTMWRTVELWDFGVDARIEIPTPMEPEPNPSLREILGAIRALWRGKRAYDRQRSPRGSPPADRSSSS